MAVENKYADSNINSAGTVTSLLKALQGGRAQVFAAYQTIEVAAADSDASVYRMFKALPPNLIPLAILVCTDGITGGTVYDVGLYETDLGAVLDADCFAANLDLSSALDLGFATALDGMDAVDIADYGKRLFEHAGHTVITKKSSYDLAFTADTVGTGAGTIGMLLIYAQG